MCLLDSTMFCLVFVLTFRYSESLFWLVSSYFCFRFYYLLLSSFAYFLLFLCFAYYCVLSYVVVFHSILFILNSRHFVHFAILLLFGSHILSASAFEHRYIQLMKKICTFNRCENVCLCVAYEFKLLAVECRFSSSSSSSWFSFFFLFSSPTFLSFALCMHIFLFVVLSLVFALSKNKEFLKNKQIDMTMTICIA